MRTFRCTDISVYGLFAAKTFRCGTVRCADISVHGHFDAWTFDAMVRSPVSLFQRTHYTLQIVFACWADRDGLLYKVLALLLVLRVGKAPNSKKLEKLFVYSEQF